MPRNRSEKEPAVEGVPDAVLEVVRIDARIGRVGSNEGNILFGRLSGDYQNAYQSFDPHKFYRQYKEWLNAQK